MITPSQCRAARGLLDWSQQQLAEAARVGVVTVRQFEGGGAQPRNATLEVLRRALEAAGVELTNGEGPGVRLRRHRPGVSVRWKKGNGQRLAVGLGIKMDAVGTIVALRPDVTLGSVERVDAEFPGAPVVRGVELALLDIVENGEGLGVRPRKPGLVVHGRSAPLVFRADDRVRFRTGFKPRWLKDPGAVGVVVEPPEQPMPTSGMIYVQFEGHEVLAIDPRQIEHAPGGQHHGDD